MKIVYCEKRKNTWYSVNFIDSNDVFVGYDDDTSCCEDAGYFFSAQPNTPYSYDSVGMMAESDFDLEGYCFNVIPGVSDIVVTVDSDDLEYGGQVSFELVHPEKETIYLHLYNSHNGYYGHEYVLQAGNQVLYKESL